MKLQTKYFGEVEYELSEIIQFPVGLLGFQEENQFLLLPFAESGNQMLCLQSVRESQLAFVVLDPFALEPEYAPVLQPAELQEMGVESVEELYFYVLCAVRNPVSASTVNMRCPLAINPHTLQARQIIMEGNEYQMRQPLSAFHGEQGGASC